MKLSGIRFVSLLLAGISIGIGSLLIGQSYSRINCSVGVDANRVILVAQMEMISGSVLIAGGLISLAVVTSIPSPKSHNDTI